MLNKKKPILRSMLFVPTYKESFINHGIESNADAIILDLEDSIPDQYKADARNNIKKYLDLGAFKNITTIVRINPLESNLLFEDLKYVLHEDIDGFMLTKIYTADDMIFYDNLITQLEAEKGIQNLHFVFTPLIETTAAVMDVYNIAKSTRRNIAITFGAEDFLNDLGGLHGEPPISLNYPRAAIAIAARAAGICAIDTPYLSFNDFEGFKKEEMMSLEMGFVGCLLIHPKQISLANECFTPDEAEIKRSTNIVDAVEKAKALGSGVAMFDKKMIGPPMEKRARKVLSLIEQIRVKNKGGSNVIL